MENKTTSSGDTESDKLTTLWGLFAIVLLLWFSSYFIIRQLVPDPAARGTIGDVFGVVNALFSGLAFCGIIYTILLQRKELKLQREELASTREELKRSATAQENSEVQMKRQADSLERQANNFKISAQLSALNTFLLVQT